MHKGFTHKEEIARAKKLGLPILKSMAKPLFGQRAKKYGWGVKKGWDAADLIDAPLRAAKGISTPLFDIKNSLLKFAMDSSDKIAELSGEQITSKNIEQKKKERGGLEEVNVYTPDLETANSPFFSGGSHYNPGTDNIQLDPSRKSKIGKKLFGESEGTSPMTMYEEMAHARGGKLRDMTQSFRKKMMKGGEISRWAGRLPEEIRAKGVGFKDVIKHEGLIEAALSVPSLTSTLASYLLPSDRFTKGESTGTLLRKRFQATDDEYNEQEFSQRHANKMLDYIKDTHGMKESIDEAWKEGKTGVNRARYLKWMAQSGSPINELKAYFGAKPSVKN